MMSNCIVQCYDQASLEGQMVVVMRAPDGQGSLVSSLSLWVQMDAENKPGTRRL